MTSLSSLEVHMNDKHEGISQEETCQSKDVMEFQLKNTESKGKTSQFDIQNIFYRYPLKSDEVHLILKDYAYFNVIL